MNTIRKLAGLAVVFALCSANEGCEGSEPNVRQRQQQQSNAALDQADREVGQPRIRNWFERRTAVRIMEMRDQAIVTYTYLQGLDGRLVCVGRSIGFALPYSVQTTNPMQPLDFGAQHGVVTVPLVEPNGLFSPTSADATWVMMINPANGQPAPIQFEPRVTVTPFELSGPAVSAPCPPAPPARQQ